MYLKITKKYGNCVSVRSYLVKKCKDSGEDLTIEHEGQIMTVANDYLKKGIKTTRNVPSKFNEQVYGLVDFLWWPDSEKPQPREPLPNQKELF